jgi:hypothetical protein
VNRLSPTLRRLLAVAILIFPLTALYLLVAAPLADDYAATTDRIARLTALRDGYRRLADRVGSERAQLQALKERQAGQNGFLVAPNATLLAADLQNRVKSLVDAARGELQSTEVLPVQDVEEGKFRRIAVRGRMILTVPAARQVLYGLEASAPLLFIDNLDLHAQAVELRRAWSPEDEMRLDVAFDVYGYARGGS